MLMTGMRLSTIAFTFMGSTIANIDQLRLLARIETRLCGCGPREERRNRRSSRVVEDADISESLAFYCCPDIRIWIRDVWIYVYGPDDVNIKAWSLAGSIISPLCLCQLGRESISSSGRGDIVELFTYSRSL
ncbi:hypothetical protein DFH27DRAFT_289333 [Peziza echinospora]|nr:hypothetical protein DFH27DRAFT_289333 [Peziza echinospora]